VEDGPTLTHGEMKIGAGVVAALKYGASELIDPRPVMQSAKLPILSVCIPI
jgi:predicted GTPase